MAKRKEWIRSTWEQIRSAWQTFLQAMPLLLFWLSIPAIVLCIGALWQASTPARELSGRSPVMVTREIPDAVDGPVLLQVAHPRKLFLEPADKAAAPLTVRLLRATPTSGPTVTPIVTTASTPIPPLPYIVSFASSQGLSFSDKDSNPIYPEIALTPAPFPVTPAVLYIRASRPPTAPLPSEAQLETYVRGPNGELNATPMRTQVTLESARESTLRRFGDLLTGTTALIIALTSALVGFGVQQWRQMAEREQKRQEEQRAARFKDIERLGNLIKSNPSEGARCYLECRERQNQGWEHPEIQRRLEESWKDAAPEELRDAVELLDPIVGEERFYRIVERLGAEESTEALEWAIEWLDDEWRQRASSRILLLAQKPRWRQYVSGDILKTVEQRPWRSVLRAWPHLSLWRDVPPPFDPKIARGLEYLGLECNPFGSEQAETDTLLLECRVDPPWLKDLDKPQPALLLGPSGSGKTATALLLAYDNLVGAGDSFPVYFSASPHALELDEIAQVVAQTQLHYLAVAPEDFLGQDIAGQSAMAHILTRYVRPNLALRFHQAGLPLTGDGDKMLRQVKRLTRRGAFQEPLTEDELLALLSEARPHGFSFTHVLLDVQEWGDEGKDSFPDALLGTVFEMSDMLARIGVFVKAFLPAQDWRRETSVVLIRLEWSSEELYQMLINRLAHCGYDTLAKWCVSGEVDPELDQKVVERADGSPRRLLMLGNALLRRIGQRESKLTTHNLDEILGPA